MAAEDGAKYLIESFKNLGYWVWIILSGNLVVIFSIIYRPEYVPLGLYIFVDGMLGYFIAMFLDRFSTLQWGEKDENKKLKKVNGKNIVEPPMWYSFVLIIFRGIIFGALVIIILIKYPEFCPFH